MNEQGKVDKTRRNLLIATSVAGGAASVGAAVPFAVSMWPSERAKAGGAPVEGEIAALQPGGLKGFEGGGEPGWGVLGTQESAAWVEAGAHRAAEPRSEPAEAPRDTQRR